MSISISDSLQRLTDTTFDWLPRLVGALVVLIITFIVARIVQRAVVALLGRAKVDQRISSSPLGEHVGHVGGGSPSTLIGNIVRWIVIILGAGIAADVASIKQLSSGIGTVVGYLPNLLAAIAILLVGIFVASFVGKLLTRVAGGTALGKIAASAAPIVILVLVSFMALTQLHIATPIVTGTFYIVLGAIALAGALAFGLGGRDAAGKYINRISDQVGKGD